MCVPTNSQLYVLYGNDSYSKRRDLARIISNSGVAEEFNKTILRDEVSLDDIIVAANTIPFGHGLRCLTVFDFVWESLSKRDQMRFVNLLDSVPDQTALIFVREDAKLSNASQKLLDKSSSKIQIINFEIPAGAKLTAFVKQNFNEHNIDIDLKCCELISQLCDKEPQRIAHEAAKLCAYARAFNKTSITIEDINLMAHGKLEQNIFELSKAILNGKIELALSILKKLFQNSESPIAILGSLRFLFSDLLFAKLAATHQVPFEQFFNDFSAVFKAKIFRAKNAWQVARTLSLESIKGCVFLLSKADLSLKHGPSDPIGILQELVCKIQLQLKK